MTTDFHKMLKTLVDARVEFILVGGVAATVHGSSRLTQDVDIVYDRDAPNIHRIISALKPLDPYLRGAPAGLPFVFDDKTVSNGLNFTLTTKIGDIDLLGEITGGEISRRCYPTPSRSRYLVSHAVAST